MPKSKKPMAQQFFRMWPRALFHNKQGKAFINQHLNGPGVYILYRDDKPYYIGKTGTGLNKRLVAHSLKPNARLYNFWNYFSAFEIPDEDDRNEIEAILISAMPTANSARPKFLRKRLDRSISRMLNDIQALMLTGVDDRSGEKTPDVGGDEE